MANDPARFYEALGQAVVDAWADLPREIQEKLFESAVELGHHTEADEALRQHLARFLHEQHERTARSPAGT